MTPGRLIPIALLAVACKEVPERGSEKPASGIETTRAAHAGQIAPFELELELAGGRPVPGETIGLIARIGHLTSWSLPIELTIQVPKGAALTSGSAHVVVTPGAGSTEQTIALELRIYEVPSADLVVVADSQARDRGVHAQARYRFGRAEPELPALVRSGPELKIGARNFGRSVALRP